MLRRAPALVLRFIQCRTFCNRRDRAACRRACCSIASWLTEKTSRNFADVRAVPVAADIGFRKADIAAADEAPSEGEGVAPPACPRARARAPRNRRLRPSGSTTVEDAALEPQRIAERLAGPTIGRPSRALLRILHGYRRCARSAIIASSPSAAGCLAWHPRSLHRRSSPPPAAPGLAVIASALQPKLQRLPMNGGDDLRTSGKAGAEGLRSAALVKPMRGPRTSPTGSGPPRRSPGCAGAIVSPGGRRRK